MIQVKIGQNLNRDNIIVDENITLKEAFDMQGIDYSVGISSLDGATLRAGDINRTFADFGVGETCTLVNVFKLDNAFN